VPGGRAIAGISPGAQYPLSAVQVAAVAQEVGQLPGGRVIAGISRDAQYPLGLVQVTVLA
jgi:hypothetical protein